ncbi:hypothetical protein LBMAG41_11630 [Cyanobium sp.]|nr:hypothetical protein LBMAG41_11630 [Cyanobium sp.]
MIDPYGCSGLSSPGQAGWEEGGAWGLAGASMGQASAGFQAKGDAPANNHPRIATYKTPD